MYTQDIKAEEAIKDWKGEKARTIKQKSNDAEHARLRIRDIERELEDYDAYDDEMSDGERNEQMCLYRNLKKAK